MHILSIPRFRMPSTRMDTGMIIRMAIAMITVTDIRTATIMRTRINPRTKAEPAT